MKPKAATSEQQTELPLETKILTWISKQGYRLEYLTYYALRDVGLEAEMSLFIKSSDSKPREIDVSCEMTSKPGGCEPFTVRIICECKSISSPWLVLESGSLNGNSQSKLLTQSPSTPDLISVHGSIQLVGPDEVVGHSIVQALKEGNKDFTYDALQKIANAANDWVNQAESSEARVCIPALVIEGSLFTAHLPKGSSDFQLKQVESAKLRWFGLGREQLIHLVTVESLTTWAKEVASIVRNLTVAYEKEPIRFSDKALF